MYRSKDLKSNISALVVQLRETFSSIHSLASSSYILSNSNVLSNPISISSILQVFATSLAQGEEVYFFDPLTPVALLSLFFWLTPFR